MVSSPIAEKAFQAHEKVGNFQADDKVENAYEEKPSTTSLAIRDGSLNRSSTSLGSSARIGAAEDARRASLGVPVPVETVRDLSPIAIIAVGWNISNSWGAVAGSLIFSVRSGGPVTLLYGLIIIFVLDGAAAATMAELASVYPTAGGQYHWTSILSPPKWSRALSYTCGAINGFAWMAWVASVNVANAQFIFALALFWNPSNYESQAWHVFLLYIVFDLSCLLYNIFLAKRSSWIHNIGFALSLSGFIVVFITCLAISNPKQSSHEVWNVFNNNTGWDSNVIVFLTALVGANNIYAGLDGCIHLAEECKNASVAVPRALFSTTVIGFVTAFAFAVAMFYSYTDEIKVLISPVPILEIWYQATRSKAAATVFLMIIATGNIFAIIACQQTASRLTFAFARDNAIFGSTRLSSVHPRYRVPVWALLANYVIIFLIGLIYLVSTQAFNAITSTATILQQVSFAIPAALLMYQKRSATFLPASRAVHLGMLGWLANALTVLLGIIALVFYSFPVVLPVTSTNMNYACAIIGVMGILATINWFTHARKHYHGPRIHFGTFERDSP